MSLIKIRVEFKFFPSMTIRTVQFIAASVFILYNFVLRVPSSTLVCFVRVKVGFTAEVLPVMCVYADFSLMILFLIRAPSSFEMKHVEVSILIKTLD